MGVCELRRLVYGHQRVRDGSNGMFGTKYIMKCQYDVDHGSTSDESSHSVITSVPDDPLPSSWQLPHGHRSEPWEATA